MIGKLRGFLDSVAEDRVIIDVGGVGYIAYCSAQTLRSLPPKGEAVSLIIETHVREDHIHLYGFLSEDERKWFNILTTVKGVGTRLAMAILSALSPAQIATALLSQDAAAFKAISGIGPKLADRIITELKDKGALSAEAPTTPASISSSKTNTNVQDAISALINLGYGRSDAFMIVNRLNQQHANATVEELIRMSLREIAA